MICTVVVVFIPGSDEVMGEEIFSRCGDGGVLMDTGASPVVFGGKGGDGLSNVPWLFLAAALL